MNHRISPRNPRSEEKATTTTTSPTRFLLLLLLVVVVIDVLSPHPPQFLPFLSNSRLLRTQKLRSCLLRTQRYSLTDDLDPP